MLRKAMCVICVLCLMWGAALETAPAETPAPGGITVEEKGLALAESSVCYPSLTGFTDQAFQKQVNDQLLADTKIADYLTRMSQLMSEGSLQVSWTGGLLGDVFSCAVEAQGAVASARPTDVWTWSNLDLQSGQEIVLSQLLADEENAKTVFETYLEEQVKPQLSAHLLSSDITPLPEGFFLERTGITLLYPIDRLITLSDRAGAVKIGWNEIREALDWSEGGILDRAGARDMVEGSAETAEKLRAMCETGNLPDIPVTLGDSLQPLTDRYHLLIDPDVYVGGRMFSLEGACFRDVFLLTDFLSESWESSVVQGIRMDRGCVWGLCIGETTRETWRQWLGEPSGTDEFDAEKAELYRTVPGSCDYYPMGEHLLQLRCDESGVLAGITLME